MLCDKCGKLAIVEFRGRAGRDESIWFGACAEHLVQWLTIKRGWLSYEFRDGAQDVSEKPDAVQREVLAQNAELNRRVKALEEINECHADMIDREAAHQKIRIDVVCTRLNNFARSLEVLRRVHRERLQNLEDENVLRVEDES